MTELKPGWQRVKFGDVVRLNKETCKDPAAEGIERVIGLEHLEPGDLRIRSWGDVADGTTFTKRVRHGQVLFGKRRAYQRKISVADFDAVCSGDIYVFESADHKRLLSELLPFICQTEAFFEYAVGTSAGSLSPRTNWKSLAQWEFALPPVEEQILILQGLNACQSAAEALHGLLSTAIALLDSSAYELLCHSCIQSQGSAPPHSAPEGWEQVKISDMCERITYGFTNPMPTTQDGPWMVTAKDVSNGVVNYKGARRTSVHAFQNLLTDKSRPAPGDVLLTKDGTLGRVGIVDRPGVCVNQSVAVLRPKKAIPSEFLAWTLRSSAMQARLMQDSGGSAIRHLYITKIGSVKLMAPKITRAQARDCLISVGS